MSARSSPLLHHACPCGGRPTVRGTHCRDTARLVSRGICVFVQHAGNIQRDRERQRKEITSGARPQHACISFSPGKWSCRSTQGKAAIQSGCFSPSKHNDQPSSITTQEPLQSRPELGTPVSSIQPPEVLWSCMLPTPGPSAALLCSVSSLSLHPGLGHGAHLHLLGLQHLLAIPSPAALGEVVDSGKFNQRRKHKGITDGYEPVHGRRVRHFR